MIVKSCIRNVKSCIGNVKSCIEIINEIMKKIKIIDEIRFWITAHTQPKTDKKKQTERGTNGEKEGHTHTQNILLMFKKLKTIIIYFHQQIFFLHLINYI